MKHIPYPGRDLTENKGVNPNEIFWNLQLYVLKRRQ